MVNLFIAALLSIGLWPAQSDQDCVDPGSFSGTIEIFEHSLFRSDDGRILAIRIEGPDAQSQLASQIRAHDKSQILCLRADFEGHLIDDKDATNRQVVSVVSFRDLHVTECVPQSQ